MDNAAVVTMARLSRARNVTAPKPLDALVITTFLLMLRSCLVVAGELNAAAAEGSGNERNR